MNGRVLSKWQAFGICVAANFSYESQVSEVMQKWRGKSDIDSIYLLICYFLRVDIIQDERNTSFVQGDSDHIQTQRICYTIVMKYNSIKWICSHFDNFHWFI